MRSLMLVPLVVAVSSCTSTQLSQGTVNVASTIEEIETHQALANFSRTIEQRFAVPSLVTIVGGTVQVVNSFTPSVSFPITSMFTRLSSATPSSTTTTSGAGATLAGTISWQQNFNIVPVTDQFALRNLSVIYRAVVWCDPAAPGALLGLSISPQDADNEFVYQPPRVYSRFDELVPDPYYLEKPNCVLCIKERNNAPLHDSEVAEKTTPNKKVFGQCWLFHRSTNESEEVRHPAIPASDTEMLGRSGSNVFYIRRGAYDAFAMFLILTLPSSPAPTRFANVSAAEQKPPSGGEHPGERPGKPGKKESEPTPKLQLLVPGPAEGNTRPGVLFVPGIQTSPQ